MDLKQQNNEEFVSLLSDLTKLKDAYVSKEILWYKEQIPKQRRLFYLSNFLVIVLSTSIPYLTTREDFWKSIILPIIALSDN